MSYDDVIFLYVVYTYHWENLSHAVKPNFLNQNLNWGFSFSVKIFSKIFPMLFQGVPNRQQFSEKQYTVNPNHRWVTNDLLDFKRLTWNK